MRIVYVLLICLVLVAGGGCKKAKHQLSGAQWEVQHELVDQGRGHANISTGIFVVDFDYERSGGIIRVSGLMDCAEGENDSTDLTIFRINFCFTDSNGVIQDVYPISYRSAGAPVVPCKERTFSRRFRDKANYKGVFIGYEGERVSTMHMWP